MEMTLRWYGKEFDTVKLWQIRQIPGVHGVITTLYNKQAGELWEQDEIKALKEKNEALEAELKGAKESLATAEQTIADKDATIASLTQQPAEPEEEGKTPANNGSGAEAPVEAGADYPHWDGHESMVAFRKRMEEWKSSHAN